MARTSFSFPFANMAVITTDGIETIVREEGNLSLTDYCILKSLFLADSPMMMSEFETFLMLRSNTLSIATSRLETAGLLEKRSDDVDLRRISLVITKEGRKVVKKVLDAIYRRFFEQMWVEENRDIIIFGMEIDARAYLACIGQSDSSSPKGYEAVPGWVMGLKYLEQLWANEVKRSLGMSLSEFRLLYLLDDKPDGLISRDAGSILGLERSAFSRVASSMRKQEYVSAKRVEDDRRCFTLHLTKKGKTAVSRVINTLETLTDNYFASVPKADLAKQDSWHNLMYKQYLKSLGF